MEKNMSEKTLEDLWFHTKDANGNVIWQGKVIRKINDKVYIVQLYEWLLGEESCMKLCFVEDMIGWDFYKTADDMREAGNE